MRIVQDPSAKPLEALGGKTVAIVGYGNQGRVHALNLRDSGVNVVVGARAGSASGETARRDGFDVRSLRDAAAAGDLVVLGLPDDAHGEVYDASMKHAMRPGTTIGVMHGFSLRYGLLKPRGDIGVVMVAPKGPAPTLRFRYLQNQGIPCVLAVHQDSPAGDAEQLALAWAAGIGCLRAAAIFASAGDEAETDLFGEQTVLCGGVSALIRAAFDTLVEAGYPPELAYIECCHELKQVADLIYAHGLAGMHQAISGTAEFGSFTAQKEFVDDALRAKMKAMLDRIRSGEFSASMVEDKANGSPWLNAQREALQRDAIERAGEAVRALMPWLEDEGKPQP